MEEDGVAPDANDDEKACADRAEDINKLEDYVPMMRDGDRLIDDQERDCHSSKHCELRIQTVDELLVASVAFS